MDQRQRGPSLVGCEELLNATWPRVRGGGLATLLLLFAVADPAATSSTGPPGFGPSNASPSNAGQSNAGQTESPALAAYNDLLEMRFSAPFDVPDGGIILQLEGARWTLSSGKVRLQRPVNGLYTGLAFEGEASFEMDVPDIFELQQLRRFSREEELSKVESALDRLYLRAAGPEITAPLAQVAADLGLSGAGDFVQAAPSWVEDRRLRWVLHEHQDADARILAALSTFGERYLRADQRLDEHGWTTLAFDAREREEIRLTRPTRNNQSVMKQFFSETWLQMDQQSDRQADGRPGEQRGGFSALRHLDFAIDLTELGKQPATGFGQSHSINTRFDGLARFASKRDGLGSLVVQLDPRAEDLHATTPEGRELTVLRFPRGQLSNHLESESGLRRFVVLLHQPVSNGEMVDLRFSYNLELVNYAPAVSWHPSSTDFMLEPVTAALEFTTRGYYDVFATGTKTAEQQRAGESWSRWEVTDPTRILGFSFARFAHAASFEWEGVPPVTIFGTTAGYLSAVRIENLQRFFKDNLQCLTESLGPPPSDNLLVTLIAAGHSQSFEGFIQVTENIAKKGALGVAVHGTKELHAGHEIAHQWWGHQVVPESDRDVWLSESLAEYSAAQCVRTTVDGGERLFARVIDAFTNEVHGSTARAWNPFARPTLALFNSYERKRMPPISHGWRAATTNNPYGNLTTLYRKGALVVHMADELLRVQTGSRDAFERLLIDLVNDPSDRLSTVHFERALQTTFDQHGASQIDWSVLFDQWVRTAEVPTWRVAINQPDPEADRGRAVGSRSTVQSSVLLEVLQEGVAPEFLSWVPVVATFDNGDVEERLVKIAGAETRVALAYDRQPQRIDFNHRGAVPAKMKGKTNIKIAGQRNGTW